MMIHTCHCDLFGLAHPIINAPMAGSAMLLQECPAQLLRRG